MKIVPIPNDLLDYIWPDVAGFIQQVVDVSSEEITLDSTLHNLKQGNGQLVVILDGPRILAATILSIKHYDSGLKALYIPIMGGSKLHDWGEQFLEFCRRVDELRTNGRKGWTKLMQPYGWEEISTIIRQKL